MSKLTFGTIPAASGAFLALSLGALLLFRPDVVETMSHAHVVAQVQSELAQNTSFSRNPSRQADAERILADACRHCSPRRPGVVPEDAPVNVQVAVRGYSGTLAHLFVGIVSFLMVNLLTIVADC